MENSFLAKEIKVMCVTADSFPLGIIEAHKELHAIVPYSSHRKYFGISRPEAGKDIVYKAAAEELEKGETEKLGLETFILKKGDYTSILIQNYQTDISAIGQAFDQLLSNKFIDPNGACIEWYINDKDVRCMVRLKN